jgi:hypothetical protein
MVERAAVRLKANRADVRHARCERGALRAAWHRGGCALAHPHLRAILALYIEAYIVHSSLATSRLALAASGKRGVFARVRHERSYRGGEW